MYHTGPRHATERFRFRPAVRMTTPMSSLAIWPGFRTAQQKDASKKQATPGMGNDRWLMTNGGAFIEGVTPDFKVTEQTAAADAQLAANMWLKHPAYKMTLVSTQAGADADNDGLIDKEEFKALLSAAGYKGGSAQALFAQIDADGDGKLTDAEIKLLSQGSSTLQSSG